MKKSIGYLAMVGLLLARCDSTGNDDRTSNDQENSPVISSYMDETDKNQLIMKKLEFRIEINAAAEEIYSTMIDKIHFKEWVSIFSSNSYFEGSWNMGEKIVYISPNERGSIAWDDKQD